MVAQRFKNYDFGFMKDGAKIFIKNEKLNKFLFVLRDDKPEITNPNKWSLVGGGIENGEKPTEALQREIKEEININVFEIKEICSKKIIYEENKIKKELTLFYFLGKTDIEDASKIKLNEGQKVSFFTIEEILKEKNLSIIIRVLIEDIKTKLV